MAALITLISKNWQREKGSSGVVTETNPGSRESDFGVSLNIASGTGVMSSAICFSESHRIFFTRILTSHRNGSSIQLIQQKAIQTANLTKWTSFYATFYSHKNCKILISQRATSKLLGNLKQNRSCHVLMILLFSSATGFIDISDWQTT